jgi:cyclopropane fatty-acyl-phospholipid synthase-like methyltransferase
MLISGGQRQDYARTVPEWRDRSNKIVHKAAAEYGRCFDRVSYDYLFIPNTLKGMERLAFQG